VNVCGKIASAQVLTSSANLSRAQEFESGFARLTLRALFYGRPEWDPMSLDEIFPKVLGKKVSRLLDADLRPVRVKIAHAILASGEPTLMADEGLDIQRATKWLPLTKCIVRRMLKNESRPSSCRFFQKTGRLRAFENRAAVNRRSLCGG
jgi:hypothetical protein